MTTAANPVRRVFRGADGNQLVADSWGDGAPVLLLHGGGQTRHSWRDIARRLADADHRAISVDMRGHGDSEWPAHPRYGVDANADDVLAILGELDEPTALVGASMGGIAGLAALGRPGIPTRHLATCLVLVDVTPRMERTGVNRIRSFMMAAPEGFASLDEAAEAVAAYLPGRPRPRSTRGLAKNLRQGDDGRYRWHWDPRILDGFDGNPDRHHTSLAAAARAVRLPTLLVRGGLSDVVSQKGVDELRQLIPQAEVADVAYAGHMVAGDDNDTFSDAILQFLSAR